MLLLFVAAVPFPSAWDGGDEESPSFSRQAAPDEEEVEGQGDQGQQAQLQGVGAGKQVHQGHDDASPPGKLPICKAAT